MTGAFGVFSNPSDADITITSVSSPSAGMMEIHEVVDKDGAMVMQPKEGGLVVPAGGTAELKPGSDHLMLMKLPAPIEAGDEVEITVVCDTGGSMTWTAWPSRSRVAPSRTCPRRARWSPCRPARRRADRRGWSPTRSPSSPRPG